jgi:hypothetical protein
VTRDEKVEPSRSGVNLPMMLVLGGLGAGAGVGLSLVMQHFGAG